jgi:hypothetical protein
MNILQRVGASIFAAGLIVLAGTVTVAQADPTLELLFEDVYPIGANITSTTNTGTAGGNATGSAYGDGSLTYTVGPNLGKAALFTDANDPGGINPNGGRIDAPVTGTTDFTITMMVRRDGDQVTFDRLLELTDDGSVISGLSVKFTDPDTINVYLGTRNHELTLANGVWTHLAIVYDHDGGQPGKAMGKVYTNGVYVSASLDASTVQNDFTVVDGLVFGVQASTGNRPFNGAMDSIKYFSSPLDDAGVLATYEEAIKLPPSGTMIVIK